MFNLYPNLPGILTEFKDGGLQLRTDPNPPQTESILLLGTATDGPVGVPVAVDASTVELVFGKAVDSNGRPNGATLVVGFEEAWNAGCRDIRLMRISGKPASVIIPCAPITVTEEKLIEEELGLADGSVITATLDYVPIEGSLVVYADDVAVDSSLVTLNGQDIMVDTSGLTLGTKLVAKYLANVTTTINGSIKIETKFAGSLYNECKATVTTIVDNQGRKIILEKPALKKAPGEQPLEYSSADYFTIEALVNAINNDPNSIFVATCDPEIAEQSPELLQLMDTTQFTGGDDELNLSKSRLFELLSGKRDADGNLIEPGAYQLLENYTVDWVVPLGVYADDELPDNKKNFAQELAMACAYISTRQHTTYGVISTKPARATDLKSIDEHVSKLLARKNDYFVLDKYGNPVLDAEGKPYDIGRFIHVVAGPDVILRNTRLGTYTANSAVIFAAMMSTMRPGSSPLNKRVPGIVGLRFNYSNAQRDRLTAARYVTYKTKNNGTIVAVEDAMTCAQPGSDYARTTTVRVVKAAVDAVKDACDPFLGEPNNVPNRNAMAAAIDKRLSAMKEAGDLSDYRFNIISTLMDQVLGRAKIELTIVPPFELRQITVVVSLTPEL
jgi:hypothetical protein